MNGPRSDSGDAADEGGVPPRTAVERGSRLEVHPPNQSQVQRAPAAAQPGRYRAVEGRGAGLGCPVLAVDRQEVVHAGHGDGGLSAELRTWGLVVDRDRATAAGR